MPKSTGGGKQTGKVRQRRDFEALRERRMAAAEMFDRGKRQVDVVVELGVSAQTASRWHRIWTEQGREGLVGAQRAGRRRRLSDEQVEQVRTALLAGPRANGFGTDLWTLARVAEVIERVTGVRYGPTQTWTILRERLGFSRQRPARRALERDDAAIATWVAKEWPRIKKARGGAGRGSSSRTSPGSASSRR